MQEKPKATTPEKQVPLVPDQPLPPGVHQAEASVVEKGKVTVSFNPFNSNRTPTILARTSKALRYFCVGLITITSTSNMFSASQATTIAFWLSCLILFSGVIDVMIGIEPESK